MDEVDDVGKSLLLLHGSSAVFEVHSSLILVQLQMIPADPTSHALVGVTCTCKPVDLILYSKVLLLVNT